MPRFATFFSLLIFWAVTAVAAPPAPTSVVVPSSDTDGKFTVTWLPSATSGVTYTLEESTSSDFPPVPRQAYVGTKTKASIKGGYPETLITTG